MKNKANTTSNTAASVAFRYAASVHIRAVNLQAIWTAFAPYGAVVSYLHDLANAAFEIRDKYFLSDYDIPMDIDNEPLRRTIKEENTVYGTLKNHMKGLTAAIRRLEKAAAKVPQVDIADELQNIKDLLAEIKCHAC